MDKKSATFIENNFNSFEYQVNTYVVFYEKGIDLINDLGILGFITPATFTYQHYFKKIRSLINKYSIINFAKYYYEVFDDADIGDGITLILSKNKNVKNDISVLKCKNRLVLTLYTLFVILVLLIKIGILLLTLFIFGLTLKII